MAIASKLDGMRFSKLVVLKRVENNSRGNTQWLCKCDCGNTTIVDGYSLKRGHTKSCGCLISESATERGREKLIDNIGERFGRLTVISVDESDHKKRICKCDCGNIITVAKSNLTSGHTKSCGCYGKEVTTLIDLTGQRKGMLTVVSRAENNGKIVRWLCKCDCGGTITLTSAVFRKGKTFDCGCVKRKEAEERKRIEEEKRKQADERKAIRDAEKSRIEHKKNRIKHPDNEKIMRARNGMINRCSPKYHEHKNYYDKGICVCDEWLGAYGKERFFDWAIENGYKDGLTLDRIDSNKGYSPENCRWASMKEQQNNRSNNIRLEIDGEVKTLKQWSEHYGLDYAMVRARYRNGWSVDRLFEPPNR